MPAIPSGEITVVIGTADGMVMEMQALMVEMSTSYEWEEYHTTELTLKVVGQPFFTSASDYIAKNRVDKTKDWKCPYCGSINRRDANFCGEMDKTARGCGATKPWTLC